MLINLETTMANSRVALSSVLETVVVAASTLNGALNAASETIGMANAYVHEAAENQRIRQIADREVFIENLINEKAQERTIANVHVENLCKKSESHRKHYAESYDLFNKLLRPENKDNVVHISAA